MERVYNVLEVLEGFKRDQEDLGGSRRVLACLEDLEVSVRVWEGPEVCWRDHESLGRYGWFEEDLGGS